MYILYGQVFGSDPYVMRSGESLKDLHDIFAEFVCCDIQDATNILHHGGILKTIYIDYEKCYAKIVLINNFTKEYFVKEEKNNGFE